MSVTIYQIAEAAGVSSSTVARALRGDVGQSRRPAVARAEEIRRIADELGYRRNSTARALSTGKTRCIGLLYSSDAWLFEGVNNDVVLGVTKTLQTAGYHLALSPIDESGGWRNIIEEGRVDAVFIFHALPDGVRDVLAKANMPVVMLGDDSESAAASIVVDDVTGGRLATEHLVETGHRQIVFYVHEGVKPHCSIDRRIEGYRQALESQHLSPLVYHRIPEDRVFEEIFCGESKPTAVVCYSDLEAAILQQQLWRQGKQVPTDVSVVAFNDKPMMKLGTPPLTTIGFDAVEIGERGANALIAAIEDGSAKSWASCRLNGSQHLVIPELIVRESTSPPTTGQAE